MARILIVEDDIGVRDLLDEILKGHGHTVEVAGTADEAVDKLSREPAFDVVTIDIVLPGGKSGLAVVFHILVSMREKPKFLVVSGMIPDAIREQLYTLGIDDSKILKKPFTIDEFVDTVSRQLET